MCTSVGSGAGVGVLGYGVGVDSARELWDGTRGALGKRELAYNSLS